MNQVPSLLMVSWNRREYFERTIAHVLSDPSDFRLYFWDNNSQDGVKDIIAGLRDDRVAERHYHSDNVGQFDPWHWFMATAAGEIGGKLDDDILGPPGWTGRLSGMLADEPRLGTLGCWVYLESDWDETLAAHKIVQIGRHRLFHNPWVPGGIFLGRLAELRRYSWHDRARLGVPLDQIKMTRDGFINGYPLPMPFAENLDDPRSIHCRMNRPGGWDQFAAYTARMRKFSGPEEYGRWIAADARKLLQTSVADQCREIQPTRMERIGAKLAHLVGR